MSSESKENLQSNQSHKDQNKKNSDDDKSDKKKERRDLTLQKEGKSLRERIFGKKKSKTRKVRLEIELYLLVFFLYIFLANVVPMALAWLYYWHVLHPIFQSIVDPVVSANSYVFSDLVHAPDIFQNFSVVMQNPINLVNFLTAPAIFLAIYILRLYLCALSGKLIYGFFNWIRPRKELNKARFDGEEADDINIYHTRNFLLRLLKWQFQKSPFPWFLPWMYDYVGSNKVGENVVIEEGLPTLEFMELGDDVYIGPMAATTSHVVEGTYQALSIYTIKFGDNVALGPRVCIAPGVKMGDDSQVLYFGGLTKLQKVRKGKDQFGVPSSRISHSKYTSVLDMPEDIQKESKDLFRERRRKMKKKRRERRAKRKKEKEKNN